MDSPPTMSVPGLPNWLAFHTLEPEGYHAINLDHVVGVKYPIMLGPNKDKLGCYICTIDKGMVPIAVTAEIVFEALASQIKPSIWTTIWVLLKKYLF